MPSTKALEQVTSDRYVPFTSPDDEVRDIMNNSNISSVCSVCGSGNDPLILHHSFNGKAMTSKSKLLTTKRKILLLLFIASLALMSIILISERLIVRHFERSQDYTDEVVTFNILTVEEWARQEPAFQDNDMDLNPHTDLIEEGIFWSRHVEAQIAPGPSDQQVQNQLQRLRREHVQSVEDPDWLHCGRGSNRFVQFDDGGRACARHRDDHVEYVQGEVMAFYLARLLGLTHVPAVALSKVQSQQWTSVLNETQNAGWKSDDIVALIEWIPNLKMTTIPESLRSRLASGLVSEAGGELTPDDLVDLSGSSLADLAQWTDIFIFDFLTGNYDRVVGMMDAAYSERKLSILKETVPNLAKSSDTSSLWLLDNEASFLSAYSILYANHDDKSRVKADNYLSFHSQLLQSLCIFRRRTINRLFAIKRSPKPAQLLLRFVSQNEPLFHNLPQIHDNSVFVKHFAERLDQVWSWIGACQQKAKYL